MRIPDLSAQCAVAPIFGLFVLTGNPDAARSPVSGHLIAAEPPVNLSKPLSATSDTNSQYDDKRLVVVQVRDESYLPGRSTSTRIDDYSAIVKDGWYHSADDSFRLRVPTLHSGKINIMRRRWEMPDGIDVMFVDKDAYWRAVFCVEADVSPASSLLKKKYADYLANQNTEFEAEIIKTRFGNTMEIVAMNWVPTRDYPYDAPSIDVSGEKMAKVGPTVGISWTFWRDGSQCGFSLIMPVDRTLDKAAAFQLAKQQIKDFSEGLEFTEKRKTQGGQ